MFEYRGVFKVWAHINIMAKVDKTEESPEARCRRLLTGSKPKDIEIQIKTEPEPKPDKNYEIQIEEAPKEKPRPRVNIDEPRKEPYTLELRATKEEGLKLGLIDRYTVDYFYDGSHITHFLIEPTLLESFKQKDGKYIVPSNDLINILNKKEKIPGGIKIRRASHYS